SHGFRARARERGRDLYGGEVDVRERRDRQLAVGEYAESQDADHDEPRHDGPADEELRQVHDALPPGSPASATPCPPLSRAFPLPSLPPPFGATLMPGTRRDCPVVTTRSPGASPLAMTEFPSSVRSTTTCRSSAVSSGLTTKTNVPLGPVWTACEGTTTASCISRSVTEATTNCPGHSTRSLLGNTARTFTVPVAGSMLFSTNATSPAATADSVLGRLASTASLPSPMYLRIGPRYCSGTAKLRYVGDSWFSTPSGPVSLAFPTLPAWIMTLPVRPLIGARIVAYSSCRRAVSTAAWLPATVASAVSVLVTNCA